MPSNPKQPRNPIYLALTDAVVGSLRAIKARDELATLMEAIAREMGFRHYALIHHDDLRTQRSIASISKTILWRLLSSLSASIAIAAIRSSGAASRRQRFLWSEISRLIHLDRQDRASFELGAREGLSEGITVPYTRLGDRMVSCTFAGMRRPERAHRYLGAAQMIGIFAFQAARRLVSGELPIASSSTRLQPRPRHCVILAGRGYSNKQISRSLALTPRTVDCYLTEARRAFFAHDRTELG